MSRSIHETRRSWQRLVRFDYSSPEEKDVIVRAATRRLVKKRRIKDTIQQERHEERPPVEAVSPDQVLIFTEPRQELIHHGATEEDIRNVLRLLPLQAAEGIHEIRLSLGKEYMIAAKDIDQDEVDPHFARPSTEIMPGIHQGAVLGTYHANEGRISIYAYVWNRAKLGTVPAVVPDFYLRLQSLSTLVHEVAHHFDQVLRTARGRWMSDRKATFEHYAEEKEWEWTREYVIPYLERRYANEWTEVKEWVRHFGGDEPTLELMSGDPRYTTRDGLTRMACSTSLAFRNLVTIVAEGASGLKSRLEYAWGLHYADEYEQCLRLSERLVSEYPQDADALTLHADTLEHLERYEEALDYADRALAINPMLEDAWDVRIFVFRDSRQWERLLDECTQFILRFPNAKLAWIHRSMAIGLCALGKTQEMKDALKKGYPNLPEEKLSLVEKLIIKEATQCAS